MLKIIKGMFDKENIKWEIISNMTFFLINLNHHNIYGESSRFNKSLNRTSFVIFPWLLEVNLVFLKTFERETISNSKQRICQLVCIELHTTASPARLSTSIIRALLLRVQSSTVAKILFPVYWQNKHLTKKFFQNHLHKGKILEVLSLVTKVDCGCHVSQKHIPNRNWSNQLKMKYSHRWP